MVPGGGWRAAVPPCGVCWHGTTPGVCTGGKKPLIKETAQHINVVRIDHSILTLGRHDKFHSTNVAYLVFAWKHRLTSVKCVESMWFLALWPVSGQRCVCKHYHRKGVRSSDCGFRRLVAWNVSIFRRHFHATIFASHDTFVAVTSDRYFLNEIGYVMFPKDSLRGESFPKWPFKDLKEIVKSPGSHSVSTTRIPKDMAFTFGPGWTKSPLGSRM